METNERRSFDLVIDALADYDDEPDYATLDADAAAVAQLRKYANLANVDFRDIRVIPDTDSHRFSAHDVTLRFDATLDDVRRYAEYVDCAAPDDPDELLFSIFSPVTD